MVELAYPPPDHSIREILVQTFDERRLRIRYHLFFCCLFAVVKQEVETMMKMAPTMTYIDLTRKWRNQLRDSTVRGKLYDKVVKDVEVMLR